MTLEERLQAALSRNYPLGATVTAFADRLRADRDKLEMVKAVLSGESERAQETKRAARLAFGFDFATMLRDCQRGMQSTDIDPRLKQHRGRKLWAAFYDSLNNGG